MRFSACGPALVAALVLASPKAATGQPVPQPAPAAVLEARAVVEEVRRVIRERYVLPERRPALDVVLAEGLASGRYRVSDPAVLAERVNADLARVGRDRHLNFVHDPQRATLLATRREGPGGDDSAYERQARQRNHGVATLRVLPGNIRYLDYRGFDWIGDESRDAIDTAMRFLAGGDAVIIDLRRNGGGSPDAVQRMISHFMEPDRPLVTFYMNGAPSPDRLASLRELAAPRMVGKPLYVLTSDNTGSAAEEFAGHVAGYRLGELVGGNTAGAGFRNDLVTVAGGFIFSVSVGRAVLASTGRDWEAVGHAPTIAVPVDRALDAAQAHASRRIAAALPADQRARLETTADGLAARSEGRSPTLPLTAYAGNFGERAVLLENGRLYYRRGNQPPLLLFSLGGHRFAFDEDPAGQIEIHIAGDRATAIEFHGAAVPGRYARTP